MALIKYLDIVYGRFTLRVCGFNLSMVFLSVLISLSLSLYDFPLCSLLHVLETLGRLAEVRGTVWWSEGFVGSCFSIDRKNFGASPKFSRNFWQLRKFLFKLRNVTLYTPKKNFHPQKSRTLVLIQGIFLLFCLHAPTWLPQCGGFTTKS